MSLSSSIASQWLNLRLQLLGLVVIVSIALLAVINAAYEIVPMSGSKLGLALSYAFALVGYVNGLVDSVSRTEQEMISVERVGEYVALPNEFERDDIKSQQRRDSGVGSVVSHIKKLLMKNRDVSSHAKWPLNGNIELFDVSFSYEMEHEEYQDLIGEEVTTGVNTSLSDQSDIENTVQCSYALSNITLRFVTGSRTVVIGRTGQCGYIFACR